MNICTLSAENIYKMLVGTYTQNTESRGIYTCELDADAGTFRLLSVADQLINPSYLALSPDGKLVYCVNETGNESAVSSFAFNHENGTLKKINSVASVGADPCYITVTDRHVITADYSGGSVSVFGRNADGSLTEALQTVQHVGKSIAPNQEKPHVHQTKFTPDGRFLIVTDLGTDEVLTYRYDADEQEKILSPVAGIKVKPGSGPRHVDFSKNGKFIYLLQENDGTVTTLSLDKNGKLNVLYETTVDINKNTKNSAADIHVSLDGKFVYATNRGTANDITCFSVANGGQLKYVQQIETGGDGPRNFTITPDGKYLFVANQRTNNIVVFEQDKKTGKLIKTDMELALPAPVCVVIY